MLLKMDGFDHYGEGAAAKANMIKGEWSYVESSISSASKRTGNYSLGANAGTYAVSNRCVIGSGRPIIGVGAGYCFPQGMPPSNDIFGVSLRNANNSDIFRMVIQSDGAIAIRNANTQIAASDPVFTGVAWHHIEFRVHIDSVIGECEVRFNGSQTPIIKVSGVNFGNALPTQFNFGIFSYQFSSPSAFNIDDLVIWDDTGDVNNNFIGPQRVYMQPIVSDGARQDWTVIGAATGHEAIDDAAPDADATCITAATAGMVSEFGFAPLLPEVAKVSGVYIPAMARLTEAGEGTLKMSMVSGGAVAEGAINSLVPDYNYYRMVSEIDPATGLPWTPEGFNAALIRMEKTI